MGIKWNSAFLGAVAVGVFCGAGARRALAYIPPSDFIIRTWVKKHKGFHRISVVSTVTGMENGQPGPVHFQAHAVFLPSSGFLKSWATDDQGAPLYGMEARAPDLPLLVSLLFEANGGHLEGLLKEKGIPIVTETDLSTLPDDQARQGVEKTRLTRWNGDPAWVIGAAPSQGGSLLPELWIEKDTFLPLRLIANFQPPAPAPAAGITAPQEPGALDELRLDNYRYYREFPYPTQISSFKAGSSQPLFQEVTQGVQVNTPSPTSRMRITENGFTPAGSSVPGPLHDLIQSYYAAAR